MSSEISVLLDENAALKDELENEKARGIHSCGPNCSRPLCVANRRIAELTAALTKIRDHKSPHLGLRDNARRYIAEQALKQEGEK